jgi:hypothetical protein
VAKKLSRAKRRDAATATLRTTAESARDIAASIQAETNPTIEFMKTVAARVAALDVDTSELDELKGEIEYWRDSIPENLQGGDKYSTLDDTANALESAIDELETIEVPEFTVPDPEDEEKVKAAKDALAELPEVLEALADGIEVQADEADNAEFPGMMG